MVSDEQGKLIILRGLPGSGKTTWAMAYLLDHPEAVRVNRDSLRPMLHGNRQWTMDDERATSIARSALIMRLLTLGYTVISDDTNLRQYHMDNLESMVEESKAILLDVIVFTPPIEECIRRDRHRAISVGEDKIREMAATMELDTPFRSSWNK